MNQRYKNKAKSIAAFLLLGTICAFLVSYAVMFLWNYTIGEIFDIRAINMWESLGLFVLCKILFGFGKGGRAGGPPWMKRSLKEKFGGLNSEEHDKMKSYMRRKWCTWEETNDQESQDK